MTPLILKGTVTSGQGNGKKYLALPWVLSQMKAKLGYTPYLGTLNLKLTAQSIPHRKQLMKAKTETISPAEGYYTGLLIKAHINVLECAIVLPQVKNYPENTLEIVAPSYLREKLHLKDGDTVEVTVTV